MSPTSGSDPRTRRNARVVLACVAVLVVMTGAAFASVPLYRAFCQATGFSGAVPRAKAAEVLKKAQDLDVPVTREQIKVQRSGVTGSGSVSIEAPYTVHISLPGYPFDLDFDPSSRNKGVM